MSNILEIVPFGEINSLELMDYYEGEILILGDNVEVDLNFESGTIDHSRLIELEKYLHTLEDKAKKAFEIISNDWDLGEKSEVARFYVEHHLDVCDQSTLKEIFGTVDIDKTVFLGALQLTRIGLYPEDDEVYAVFDIQASHTDYLINVTFDNTGKLADLCMES